VFVEKRPGVSAASTLVAKTVDPRNSGHSSLFCFQFDLRGFGKGGEGNDNQQLLAVSVQFLNTFLVNLIARTQPLVRNFRQPSSICIKVRIVTKHGT
jgi:hypothetical protein